MSLRTTIHVDGLGHKGAPIPTASKVGPLLHSGGIIGVDRATGQIPQDLSEQCRNMFDNLSAVVQAAGGSTDHIVKMTVWMADRGARDALNVEWLKMFPDETSRPARHVLENKFPAPIQIQCEIMAYIPD